MRTTMAQCLLTFVASPDVAQIRASVNLAVAATAIGGSIIVVALVALSVWLYRRRQLERQDEEAAINKLQHYEFEPKDIRLIKTLQEPQVAHIPPTIRTSFILPNSTSVRGGSRTAYEGSQGVVDYPDAYSPPARSSVWRGRQWVTVTRPKINPPPAGRQRNNTLATQSVIGEREKKSRVERLSQLISKMKSEFKDVEL
jgi:hypothetical protein